MKAVVLAGGRGERLRPITDTRPKPLVPVLARPVMDYILSLLAHHGFDRAFVTTHYFSRQIRDRYGHRAFGLELSYLEETTPLGTCGGVKLLEEELAGEEAFLVIAGDSVCDFDLSSALAFHREKKADVTVVLSGVESPLEYGVVPLDEKGHITGFAEKPDWSETLSEWVNTGIYVLSPKVLSFVPAGRPFDFAKDLFPLLLERGLALYGFKATGYWCDIGQLSSFYRCNRDLLSGKAKTYLPREDGILSSDQGITYVSGGAGVEESAVFYQQNILSPGARVAKNAQISDSIVMENAIVGEGAVVKGAILCENARLSPQSLVSRDCVVGAGSVLEKGAVLPEGTLLSPESRVEAREAFEGKELAFTELGTTLGGQGLDEGGVLELARRAAGFFPAKIGVLAQEQDAAAATFAALFENALAQNGAEVLSFGSGPRELASFLAKDLAVPTFFTSSHRGRAAFFGYEADSLPFLRGTAAALSRSREGRKQAGFVWRLSDGQDRYVRHLSRILGSRRGAVEIRGQGGALFSRAVLKSGMETYLERDRARVVIHFTPQGPSLSVDGEELSPERAKLFVCLGEWELGKRRFAIPEKESPFLQKCLRDRGCTLLPFSLAHTARNQGEVRALAAQSARFFWDPGELCARVLARVRFDHLEETKEEIRRLPQWHRAEARFIPKEEDRARLIPAALALESEAVRILPGAFAIRILTEAVSMEAAEDLVQNIRGKLNEYEKELGSR